MKTYIGIDNGVTGSIGVVSEDFCDFILTPVRKEQNYTKARDQITRVDVPALRKYLEGLRDRPGGVMVVMERPLINPKMFKSTISAVRCMEAEQCVLESLGIPYMFIDSREWQRTQLPKGTSGTPELKKASVDMGRRLFPQFGKLIEKHKDADGLLMARHAYRERL